MSDINQDLAAANFANRGVALRAMRSKIEHDEQVFAEVSEKSGALTQDRRPLDALGFSPTITSRLNSRLFRRDNGCLEWVGAQYRFGHGAIARGPRGTGNEATHRVAWMLANGPIPAGMWVLHICDNPPCCEPTHLYLGTMQDNADDRSRRGRSNAPRGSTHPRYKYSDEQIVAMQNDYKNLKSYAQVARKYNMGTAYARLLILGVRRKPDSVRLVDAS